MKKIGKVLLCAGLLFVIVGCSDSSTNPSDSQQNTNNETEESKIFKIGDIATFTSGGVDMCTIKINSVKSTKERNQFEEKKYEDVVLINYTYENVGDDEDVYISGALNFTVIDEDGNVCDTYPIGSITPKETPKGAKCTAEEAYGLIKKSSKIKLRVKMSEKAQANFELDLNK